MKVCIIAFGALDYSVALAKSLSNFCQIDFYCSQYHLEKRDPTILDPLRKDARVICYGKYRNRDFRNLFVYRNLFNQIKNNNYDVIHLQEYGPPWMMAWWWKLPSNIVMTVHDPYQHLGLPRLQKIYQDVMQYILVNKARKIIVHGKQLKKDILERYKRKTKSDIFVLPHGDLNILKHWDEHNTEEINTTGKKTILFFGTMRANKGIDYLIKAESILRMQRQDYQIILAGECENFSPYAEMIEENAQIRVISEFIPNKKVKSLFEKSYVIALPYLSATQSGVVPLAYSFGIPVVATRVGSIAENVIDGVTGFLIEPRDEKSLAHAIIRLLDDPKLRNEMSHNASNFCKNNLSWEKISKKTMEIYHLTTALR